MTLTRPEALVACPFCGGRCELLVSERRSGGRARITCANLSCPVRPIGLAMRREVDAIAAWNQRAHFAQPAIPEWLPIESAPRDGTHILVSNEQGVRVTSFWANGQWKLVDYKGGITQWQPLPSAPTNAQIGGGEGGK